MKDYQSYIDAAVEQFRTLITQQLDRELKMEEGATAKDFTKLPSVGDIFQKSLTYFQKILN